ncbi:hypothetical protein [Gloeothece citriformis]|uniref:hypothetical protein n=1 Tax=Gloeothece citriformis TaxID=2546356 RepID=UPI000301C302|nr:hypothetical protein [Gloeothece citriformis]
MGGICKVAQTSHILRVGQGKLEDFLLKTVSWSLGWGKLNRHLLVLAIPVAL